MWGGTSAGTRPPALPLLWLARFLLRLMTDCNGCGRCCDPVVLPYTQNEIRRLLPGYGLIEDENRRFVLEDLTPIRPRRRGLEMVSDYMAEGAKSSALHLGEPMILFSHFYECRWYDRETRQCLNYDDRPPMCREFPTYGDWPDPTKAIPPECSYNADCGRPVKPISPPTTV